MRKRKTIETYEFSQEDLEQILLEQLGLQDSEDQIDFEYSLAESHIFDIIVLHTKYHKEEDLQ